MPKYKDGVDCSDMSDSITKHWETIDKAHEDTVGGQATITSCRDGDHMEGSKHYTGEAVDVRRPAEDASANALASKLREKLGPDYDVVVEKTHVHVEHDPK